MRDERERNTSPGWVSRGKYFIGKGTLILGKKGDRERLGEVK